jgi:RimJ/RimL family protein N-acetyltransferase
MVDPVVRRLRANEVKQARELRLAALADAPEAFLRSYEEEANEPRSFWRRRAHDAARSDWVATFVAVAGERHLGTATGLWQDRQEPAELVGIWVEPRARRRGLGGALVEAVCEWAADGGASSIELEVRIGNVPARSFYQRCGFVDAGLPPIIPRCDLRLQRALALGDGRSPGEA